MSRIHARGTITLSLLLVLDDDLFLAHETPRGHPERPERLVGARRGLARFRDRMTSVPPRPATEDELALVHDRAYVRALARATADGEGRLDPDTWFGPGTWDAALGAAGGVVDVARALCADRAKIGVCLVRPPGHHALSNRAMGFCLLNNVACAAAAARAEGKRVLVVDWDVHHGNGTQDAFFADAGVLYFSIHQHPFYPGTGRAAEVGSGEGAGFTVNVPLPAGAGDAAWTSAAREILDPIATAFAPELVLVSAGFDAGASDPLAGMEVTPAGFRALGSLVARIASRSAGGRVGLVLEGGYDVEAIGDHLAAALDGIVDGRAAEVEGEPRSVDRRAIEQAREVQRRFWRGL